MSGDGRLSWEADKPQPGHWLIRCCRECPEVAARIFWAHTTADPVSGEPMERSPHLCAEVGLDVVDWREVWLAVEFCESSPEQQHLLSAPPLSHRTPRHGRQPALQTAPLALWKQQRARRISADEYKAQIRWLEWASRNSPNHPEHTFRKRIAKQAMPVPRFGANP